MINFTDMRLPQGPMNYSYQNCLWGILVGKDSQSWFSKIRLILKLQLTPVRNEWSHAFVLFQNKQDRLLLSDLGGTQPLFLHWWRHHLDWMFPIYFCIYFQSIFAFVKSQFRLNAFQFTFAFSQSICDDII